MDKSISAFAKDHVELLTGVSASQLQHWDRSGFCLPSCADPERRAPFGTAYSFADIVALRVLNSLRNQFNVPLQHLREVSERLSNLDCDRWTGTRLWVLNRRVFWEKPNMGRPQEIASGQYVVPLALDAVMEDTEKAIPSMSLRVASESAVAGHSRHSPALIVLW